MANSKTAVAAAGGANVAARSSLWDSIRACGIFGTRVKKEELKRRIVIPLYLRSAMAAAIRDQDASVGVSDAAENRGSAEADEMPEAPIVVFVNSRSGGRHGPELKIRVQELISEEQVFMHFPLLSCACYCIYDSWSFLGERSVGAFREHFSFLRTLFQFRLKTLNLLSLIAIPNAVPHLSSDLKALLGRF